MRCQDLHNPLILLGTGSQTLLSLRAASLQTGCRECVWEVYWRDLRAYDAAQARVRRQITKFISTMWL